MPAPIGRSAGRAPVGRVATIAVVAAAAVLVVWIARAPLGVLVRRSAQPMSGRRDPAASPLAAGGGARLGALTRVDPAATGAAAPDAQPDGMMGAMPSGPDADGFAPYDDDQARTFDELLVDGDRLYAVHGGDIEERIQVWDIRAPLAPRFLGQTAERFTFYDALAVAGGRLLASTYKPPFNDPSDPRARVRLLSVDDPAQPKAAVDIDVDGRAIAADGDTAYIADPGLGLRVWDMAGPDAPIEVGAAPAVGASAVVAAGGIAFVVTEGEVTGVSVIDRTTHLLAFDVGAPSAPRALGTVVVGRYSAPRRFAVDGGLAFVPLGDEIVVIDVSDPGAMRERSRIEVPPPMDLVAMGGRLYVRSDFESAQPSEVWQLRVYDVSDPDHPAELGALDLPAQARSIAAGDRTIYVATAGALLAVDASDPAKPVIAADAPATRSWVESIAVADGWLYLADRYRGVRVVDARDPARPVEAAALALASSMPSIPPEVAHGPEALAIDGEGHLFAGDSFDFHVVDIHDPARPREIGRADGVALTVGPISLFEGYAYVPSLLGPGILVIDARDPTRPRHVGDFAAGATEGGLTVVAADHLYRLGIDLLEVFALDDPAAPTSIASISTGAAPYSIAVAGGYAYMPSDSDGVAVFDVRRPSAPRAAGTTSAPAYDANAIAVADGYAYTAATYSGLRVSDVRDPAHPREVRHFGDPGYAFDVKIDGGYLYVAHGDGVRIYRLAEPGEPVEVGRIAGPG
ncbi:MAG: hypothetical protein U0470_10320 [Anaerolineae bacterium]